MTDANTGYIYLILPYYGSLTSKDLVRRELPINTRIVLHHCQKLLDNRPDRYYTCLPLAEELFKPAQNLYPILSKLRLQIK